MKISRKILKVISSNLVMADPKVKVHELFENFWTWRLQRSPEFATMVGSKLHNANLETFTEERFEEDKETCQGFIDKARELELPPGGDLALNVEFFIAELNTFVEGYPFKGWI